MTHEKKESRTVINCRHAAGDRVKFFPPKSAASGEATIIIAYNLGHDFHSCSPAERTRRVVGLFELFKLAFSVLAGDINAEFKNGSRSIESPKRLTGERLKAELKEIDRKYSKNSLVVQGGLPSNPRRLDGGSEELGNLTRTTLQSAFPGVEFFVESLDQTEFGVYWKYKAPRAPSERDVRVHMAQHAMTDLEVFNVLHGLLEPE
jgi:hypothetical protein